MELYGVLLWLSKRKKNLERNNLSSLYKFPKKLLEIKSEELVKLNT